MHRAAWVLVLLVAPSSAFAQSDALERQRHFQVESVTCTGEPATMDQTYGSLFRALVRSFRPLDVARAAPRGGRVAVAFSIGSSGVPSDVRVVGRQGALDALATELVATRGRIRGFPDTRAECEVRLTVPAPIAMPPGSEDCIAFCNAIAVCPRVTMTFPEGSCAAACAAGSIDADTQSCASTDCSALMRCMLHGPGERPAPLPVSLPLETWVWIERDERYLCFTYTDRTAGPSAGCVEVPSGDPTAEHVRAIDRTPSMRWRLGGISGRALTRAQIRAAGLPARPQWRRFYD